ncbi:Mechanosensitive ion channel-domain-containing protein [Cladochytrium replicatum]|nr:Mechanosensitive ion channel-domain-containing protein [Cladochytrium replicatum]
MENEPKKNIKGELLPMTELSFVENPPAPTGADQAHPRGEEEFDWELDENTPSGAQNDTSANARRQSRTCCLRCLSWYQRWPLLLRTILYCISGNVIFMAPGIVSLVFFVQDTIGGYPVFVFSIYLCVVWTAWFGIRWALSVLPEIILRLVDLVVGTTTDLLTGEPIRNDLVEHVVGYIRYMKPYITFVLWCVTEYKDASIRYNWQTVGQLLWLNFTFAGVIVAAEKLLLQVFSVGFHQRAYQDRLKQNREAISVLEKLNRARRFISKSLSSHESHIPAVPPEASMVGAKFFNKFKGITTVVGAAVGVDRESIDDHSSRPVQGEGPASSKWYRTPQSTGVVLRSAHDAKMLAKAIFETFIKGRELEELRKYEQQMQIARNTAENTRIAACTGSYNKNNPEIPLSKDLLFPSDFLPWFDSKEEAMHAFSVFDRDGNGDVSRSETKLAVLDVFRERRSLEASLRDADQAISKLDELLKVFVVIVIIFVTLGIWNVDTSGFLTAAISVWAGALFAVGGTVKSLLENIIFLFGTHPYDVGDRIDVGDNDGSFVVKEFGLLTTILRKVDGRECYGPNSLLSGKFIYNVRRSGPQSEEVILYVSTANRSWRENVEKLQSKMREFLSSDEMVREFTGQDTLTVSMSKIVDRSTVSVSMGLEHKSNWQDGTKRTARRNKFMFALKEAIEDVGLELAKTEMDIQLVPNASDGLITVRDRQYSP